MADNTADADDDLELKPANAGTMFRLEMFTTNFLLGYWKQLVAVVVVFLVLILAWGQYQDITRRTQREATARIAEKVSELPQPLPMLSQAIASGEEIDAAKVQEVGDGLVAIANGTRGTAKVEALLTAAEAYRLAGAPDKQREALSEAVPLARGVLHYSASSALANLELEQGQGDEAVKRFRELGSENEGYLAEQAQIDLALALEHLGRNQEAADVYQKFLDQFPDSPRRAIVEQRRDRVTAAGAGGSEGSAG
ncbi:MAG: tetratricopeptide repeat protein [Myxococcota bacterium]